ncbi:unnamed protein product [Mytilus coruscus]|uniref:Reverse transcriptase domain-containing protein n=1 Tax=Mytilus coruscus TaxID=42192 RepID=A0A6J8EA63_MYTCO|nr:unnamed protein product [Mytilus coruscus]
MADLVSRDVETDPQRENVIAELDGIVDVQHLGQEGTVPQVRRFWPPESHLSTGREQHLVYQHSFADAVARKPAEVTEDTTKTTVEIQEDGVGLAQEQRGAADVTLQAQDTGATKGRTDTPSLVTEPEVGVETAKEGMHLSGGSKKRTRCDSVTNRMKRHRRWCLVHKIQHIQRATCPNQKKQHLVQQRSFEDVTTTKPGNPLPADTPVDGQQDERTANGLYQEKRGGFDETSLDNLPQLEDFDKYICEHSITIDAIIDSFKGMENTKSPGTDGLCKEFYIKCIDTFAPMLLKLYENIFDENTLSDSHLIYMDGINSIQS